MVKNVLCVTRCVRRDAVAPVTVLSRAGIRACKVFAKRHLYTLKIEFHYIFSINSKAEIFSTQNYKNTELYIFILSKYCILKMHLQMRAFQSCDIILINIRRIS